jgi:hypothetical protein
MHGGENIDVAGSLPANRQGFVRTVLQNEAAY